MVGPRPRWEFALEVIGIIGDDAHRFVGGRLGTVLIMVVSSSALTALGPLALKCLVDGFTGSAAGNSLSPFSLICAYVLSQFLARVVSDVRGLVYASAERRLLRQLSSRVFAHVLRLPLRFHLDRGSGAISQSIQNGLAGYQLILHHVVFACIPAAVELGTVVVVLSRLAPSSFLVLFCGALIACIAVFAHAAKSIGRSAKRASAAHVDAVASMTDALLNVEQLKCCAAESVAQARVGKALSRTEAEWVGFYRDYAANGVRVSAVFAVFLATTALYAVKEVEAAHLTVGDFVLINTYMLQVFRPVEEFGLAIQGFSQGVALLDKMLTLFREKGEPVGLTEAFDYDGPGQLEFDDVTLSYGTGRAVVSSVSFKISAGQTIGVVGMSGSGKSTLVRLLMRLLEPDSGRILLDGVPFADLSLSMVRRAIAVVPQDTVLFNESIRDNIALGKGGCTQDEIERAARKAHLHDFIARLPEAYDTNVGERGLKLSGGERQRLSIARAALKRPRVYIFDEATSALDVTTEQSIVRNLRAISRDTTTLIITHRLSTVRDADEILVMEAGAVVERGTHISLLEQRGRYAASWAAQQSGHNAAHSCAMGVRSE